MARKPEPKTRKKVPSRNPSDARTTTETPTTPPSTNEHPQLIVKRIRGSMLFRDEGLDQAAARRIYRAIEDFEVGDGGPTPTIGRWYRAVSHMPALTELADELDLLGDCNFSFTDSGGRIVTPHPEALRRILLVRFLAGLVDRDGWYPARWYEAMYGIEGPRLRKWVSRRKLASRKRPNANGANQTVYPFAGVRDLAPDVIIDLMPPGERDKA